MSSSNPRSHNELLGRDVHAANGVVNQQLLEAALAYLELLRAHQDLQIVTETEDKTATLAKLTSDFAEAGQGLAG